MLELASRKASLLHFYLRVPGREPPEFISSTWICFWRIGYQRVSCNVRTWNVISRTNLVTSLLTNLTHSRHPILTFPTSPSPSLSSLLPLGSFQSLLHLQLSLIIHIDVYHLIYLTKYLFIFNLIKSLVCLYTNFFNPRLLMQLRHLVQTYRQSLVSLGYTTNHIVEWETWSQSIWL